MFAPLVGDRPVPGEGLLLARLLDIVRGKPGTGTLYGIPRRPLVNLSFPGGSRVPCQCERGADENAIGRADLADGPLLPAEIAEVDDVPLEQVCSLGMRLRTPPQCRPSGRATERARRRSGCERGGGTRTACPPLRGGGRVPVPPTPLPPRDTPVRRLGMGAPVRLLRGWRTPRPLRGCSMRWRDRSSSPSPRRAVPPRAATRGFPPSLRGR